MGHGERDDLFDFRRRCCLKDLALFGDLCLNCLKLKLGDGNGLRKSECVRKEVASADRPNFSLDSCLSFCLTYCETVRGETNTNFSINKVVFCALKSSDFTKKGARLADCLKHEVAKKKIFLKHNSK